MSEKKRVLSAVQPTGDLHLGNYFGAIQNWMHLQEEYQCTFGVVDYHSMTMPYKPDKLRQNTWTMIFQLIACGIRVENLFIQSLIPEHAELSWILSCVTSYGEMTRMTQFKDKTDQLKSSSKDALISSGLFMYPILQAADILIYKADFVPVGKDQEQHLELTRNIATRFNHQFNKDYFALPEPLFTKTPKVLSLADPSKKMSKSLGEKHYINLFGDPGRIEKQVRSAVTDTGEPSKQMSPGVRNLFGLLKACKQNDLALSLEQEFHSGQLKYSHLKEAVSNALIELTTPIKDRYNEILANKKQTKSLIRASSADIRNVARQTLKEVKEITGIMNPKL